jgi:hypothetical protein
VYFDGLMALQLELQKKVLFNTNAAQLNTLDNVGDSSSKIDEEEEVSHPLFPFTPLPFNPLVRFPLFSTLIIPQ